MADDLSPRVRKQIDRIADSLVDQQRRLRDLERSPQIPFSSLHGSLPVIGDDDTVKAIVGKQQDGTYTTKSVDGPVPAAPSQLVVEAGESAAAVSWDGRVVTGGVPADFKTLRIEAALEGSDDWLAKGVIPAPEGGSANIGLHAGDWLVRGRVVSESGKVSAPGVAASVTIEPPVDVDAIQADIDDAKQRLDEYRDNVAAPRFQALEEGMETHADNLADARDRLETAEQTLSPLPGRIESAERDVETAKEAAESAEARAVEASNNASNRLTNGGFELGLDHWTVTNVSLSDDAHTGNQAALIGSGGSLVPDASIPVSEGDVWDVSAFGKGGTVLVVDVLNAADSSVLESFSTPMGSAWSETGRQRVEIPAGVDYMNIRITGDNVLVDDVVLRDVTDVVRLERAATAARQEAEQAIAELELMRLAVDGEGGLKDRLTTAETVLETKADESALDQLDQKLAGDLAAFESHYTRIWRQDSPPPAGVSYEWWGEPYNARSLRRSNGVVTAWNQYPNPTFRDTTGDGFPDGLVRYATGGNTGTYTVTDDGVRVESSLNSAGRFGIRANRLSKSSRDEVRVHFTADLADGHYVSVYMDQTLGGSYNGRSVQNVTTSGEHHVTLPLRDAADGISIAGLWLDRGSGTSSGESSVTFHSIYIVPRGVESFDGDTESDRANDLWYNQDGVPHEWVNGEGWTELTDARLGQIADDAKQYADTQDAIVKAEAAADAQTKADQAKNDAETAAATHADLVAQGAEDSAIAEAARLHDIAVAKAEAAQQRAEEAHDEAGSAWSHADVAMNRAVTAESNAIAEARAELAALEVGARNLLRNSDFRDAEEHWTWQGGRDSTITTGLMTLVAGSDFYQPSSANAVGESFEHGVVSVRARGSHLTARFGATTGQQIDLSNDYEWHTVPITSVGNGNFILSGEAEVTHVKLEKGTKATDWQPAPEDIQARIDQAKEDAQAHADNMPKSLGGTTPPTGTAPDGSVWRQRDATNTIIARWERINGSWVPQQVSGEVIDNLEAGKITALYTEFAESVIGTIWGQLGVFDRLEAREGWIGGTMLEDGVVVTKVLEATEQIITNMFSSNYALIEEKLVVENEFIANNADIISAAIKNLSVTERADLFEAFITTLGAQEATINLLVGTEAWIGGTMLKDETVTARHIEVTETLVGSIAELLHLVVGSIDANALWADQTWQNAGHFGHDSADQSTRVDGTGLRITKRDHTNETSTDIVRLGGAGIGLTFTDETTEETTGSLSPDGDAALKNVSVESLSHGGRPLQDPECQDYVHPSGNQSLISWRPRAVVGHAETLLPNNIDTLYREYGFIETSAHLEKGRSYWITVTPFLSRNARHNSNYLHVRYTNDGTPPDGSSPFAMRVRNAVSGNDNDVLMHGVTLYTPPVTGTYRFMASVYALDGVTLGLGGQTVQLVIEDAGAAVPDTTVIRDTYMEHPSGTPDIIGPIQSETTITTEWHADWFQNYTHNGTRRGPNQNTPTGYGNNILTQGVRSAGHSQGRWASLFGFPAATESTDPAEVGKTLAAATAGADIHSVTLVVRGGGATLHTNRTYFNFEAHAHTNAPNQYSGGIPISGDLPISVGQTVRINIPVTQFGAMLQSGDLATIGINTGSNQEAYGGYLWWYTHRPRIIISYTK